jgi:hypothetical protein
MIPAIRILQRAALTGLLFSPLLSPPAYAIAYWGTYSATLWNTPSQYFTNQDWQLFESTLQRTLDSAPDGQTNTWTNAATKATGEFTVLKSVKKGEQDCRQVKIASQAGGLRRVTGIAFCKEDDGTWKAIPGRNQK